jgi:hypothetical protein
MSLRFRLLNGRRRNGALGEKSHGAPPLTNQIYNMNNLYVKCTPRNRCIMMMMKKIIIIAELRSVKLSEAFYVLSYTVAFM